MPKQITGDESIAPKDSYQYHSEDGTITIVNKWDGLTIRQDFAARAMQAFLSIYDDDGGLLPNEDNIRYMVKVSVKAADALIAELNKEV